MNSILVAHVADQLQFDYDCSYDFAAQAAAELLAESRSLVAAASAFSEELMDAETFAAHVRDAGGYDDAP